MKIKQLREW